MAQFRVDGFTLNRLKAYTSWEQLFPEAVRLWELYREIASLEFVSRVALRYINRLELSRDTLDLSRSLAAPPRVPEDLPQNIASFLTRVVTQDETSGCVAIITQALNNGLGQDHIAVILDIDTFKAGEFQPSLEWIRPLCESLRDLKNKIFFSSVTDELLGRYE